MIKNYTHVAICLQYGFKLIDCFYFVDSHQGAGRRLKSGFIAVMPLLQGIATRFSAADKGMSDKSVASGGDADATAGDFGKVLIAFPVELLG